VVTRRDDLERWRRPDLGLATVEQVYKLWQVDEAWSVREQRGFAWWAGAFRQRVFVDAGHHDRGHLLYRISAVTDLLSGIDSQRPRIAETVAELNRFASSYALTFDEAKGSIRLCSSVVLHEHIAEWLVRHFAALAIVQVIDAQVCAAHYGDVVGGVPDTSQHPRSGLRHEHDDMLNVIDAAYHPAGKEPSRWTRSGEFQKATAQLREAGLVANADEEGLSTEVAFGAENALITASGDEPHPQLGHGVLLRLSLPVTLSEAAAATLALDLSSAEGGALTSSHVLGAWCSAEQGDGHIPVFVSFVPNAVYRPRLLFNLVVSLAMKAQWARELIAPYAKDGGR
jgi:hypothetical protein